MNRTSPTGNNVIKLPPKQRTTCQEDRHKSSLNDLNNALAALAEGKSEPPGKITPFPIPAAPTHDELLVRLGAPPATETTYRKAGAIIEAERIVYADATAGRLHTGTVCMLGKSRVVVKGRTRTAGAAPRWCVRVEYDPPFLSKKELYGYLGQPIPNIDHLPIVK